MKHGLDIRPDVQRLPCIKGLLGCFETLASGRNVLRIQPVSEEASPKQSVNNTFNAHLIPLRIKKIQWLSGLLQRFLEEGNQMFRK
jgi:hypothetical protein